jgi:hypothetical protein
LIGAATAIIVGCVGTSRLAGGFVQPWLGDGAQLPLSRCRPIT